jgi:hypothetical protein
LIGDYFRVETENDREHPATHWNVPGAKRQYIRFVIASLPDPVHTHMALLFDRGIEAIQSAAQASGYLFSRAWMPWDISMHSESTDFTVRLAQAKFREEVESLPGLMIFQNSSRTNAANATILFVFVVGETPTGGLRLAQFQNALKIRRSILADADPSWNEAKVLRIFGPTFSGSLLSLHAVLNAQPRNRFSRILIRSGTISSGRAVNDFCEAMKTEWPDPKDAQNPEKPDERVCRPNSNGRPDFATFQFSDAYQEYYLGLFFSKREHLHSHVAILSEDETAFGSQESSARGDPSERSPSPAACSGTPQSQCFPFLRLYFPRGIAQLRDAYQRDVKTQTATDGAKSQPQSGLTLSLSATGNDDDSVAPYSILQTPLSQESVLQGIVATLRMEHAKVVVIRAADPLDMVFLSRYLRQNYPQARLVTIGSDLLMVHDFYDPRFHGILAVSAYPLLSGAEFPALDQTSSDKDNRDVQRLFSGSFAVGDFNAFHSLLAADAEGVSELLPAAGYAQFGLPSFLEPKETVGKPEAWRAHLWLTAVGRDGYWPVAVLDDVSGRLPGPENRPDPSIRAVGASLKLAAPPYSVHFTVGWTILWVWVFGLTVLLTILLAYPRVFSRSEILGRFGGQPSRERNCLLFVASVLLLAGQTVFVFPVIVWIGRFAKFDRGSSYLQYAAEVFNGMWLVMFGYAIGTLALGAACRKGFKARGAEVLAVAGAVLCGAALLATVLFTWTMWSRRLSTDLGAFVYRYIHVGSGVSPSLPLLFLLGAWIWWCWQSLTGATSTKEKHMILPSVSDFDRDLPPDANGSTRKGLPEAAERVRLKALAAGPDKWPWKALGTIPFDKKMVLTGIAGFLVIYLLMRPGEIAEAFESEWYKGMYWFLLYSCLLLVCCLVAHIIGLWLEFRTLLRAIEGVPFRRGFFDLKSLTWKPLWKLAGSGRQEFVQLLGQEVEALNEIRKGLPESANLAQAIDDVRNSTNDVSAAYEPVLDGNPGSAGDVQGLFHALQDKLATCVSEALLYANEQWKTEKYEPSVAKQDVAVESPAKNPTTRAVERFLCLFYVNVILVPLRRLQTLILALAGVFVFVLLSYSSYPFESRESFHALLIAIFFAISLVVGVVYGQMYANPLLSRITNTKPGELGLDFWVRIGTFVFIPLLSLVSVQFPEINNFLFSWLQPALQSIK